MQKYEAIIFDIDGTLLDSHGVILGAFQATLKKHGLGELSKKQLKQHLGKKLIDIYTDIAPEHPLEPLAEHHRAHYKQTIRECQLFDGVPEMLSVLHESYKLGAISGKTRSQITQWTEDFSLEHIFKAYVGSDEVQKGKPSPDALIECCNRLSVEPINTLYVGDTVIDAEAAALAYMPFIAVTHEGEEESDFSDYPTIKHATDTKEVLDIINSYSH